MNHRRPYYAKPDRWAYIRGGIAELVAFVGFLLTVVGVLFAATWVGPR